IAGRQFQIAQIPSILAAECPLVIEPKRNAAILAVARRAVDELQRGQPKIIAHRVLERDLLTRVDFDFLRGREQADFGRVVRLDRYWDLEAFRELARGRLEKREPVAARLLHHKASTELAA